VERIRCKQVNTNTECRIAEYTIFNYPRGPLVVAAIGPCIFSFTFTVCFSFGFSCVSYRLSSLQDYTSFKLPVTKFSLKSFNKQL